MSALLLSVIATAAAAGAGPTAKLTVGTGEPVNPYLFGYCAEAYVGITLNKLFNDTAGIAAAKALNAQVLRYPGGTLSNTWNPMSGQYVEPSPFPTGYPDGYDKWQTWGKAINADYPSGTFTASQWLAPGNLGSVTKRTLWDLNVYSFNTTQTCNEIAYIGSLPGQQEPGVVLELGNELYIGNQGLPRFPSGESYAEQMVEVVACARKHMPKAIVAAVGAAGKWNQGLRKNAHLFDAISWHAYEPHGSQVNPSGRQGGHNHFSNLTDRVSFIAGYGRAVSQQAAAQVKADVGVAKPLVHSEFGYGLDQPGHCVLDELLNGALHGVFHVSRIIEAINTPNTFAAITLESFVGGTTIPNDPPAPVDPQAGNRTDNWCGLAASTVPMFHSNRPDLARIAGTGQLFSHFSATASRSDTMHMRPVAVKDGPELHFPILNQPPQPCLQAVAFSEAADRADGAATRPSGGGVTMSLSVLNICSQTITTSLSTDANADAQATLYSLLDGGSADPGKPAKVGRDPHGWAPLPAKPAEVPWASGPLHPTRAQLKASGTGELSMSVPGLTFCIVDISAVKADS